MIDPQTRTIYVAGAVGNTTTSPAHEIHALSPDDGSERPGWPIDVTGMTSGSATFAPPPQNQRSALSLVNGILYVAYGGHNGDCGNYRGWVDRGQRRRPDQARRVGHRRHARRGDLGCGRHGLRRKRRHSRSPATTSRAR